MLAVPQEMDPWAYVAGAIGICVFGMAIMIIAIHAVSGVAKAATKGWQKLDRPDSWLTRPQKVIVWLSVAVLSAMLAFPPWISTVVNARSNEVWDVGYQWIGRPTQEAPSYSTYRLNYRINWERLSVQIGVVVIVAFACFITMGRRRSRQNVEHSVSSRPMDHAH